MVPLAPARGVVGRRPILPVPGMTLVVHGTARAAPAAPIAVIEEADAPAGTSEATVVQGVPPAEADTAAPADGREAVTTAKPP